MGDGGWGGRDGILLLQVTGRDDSSHRYAKHAFLSYNHTQQGTLWVECRQLAVDGRGEEDFPLTDSGEGNPLFAERGLEALLYRTKGGWWGLVRGKFDPFYICMCW